MAEGTPEELKSELRGDALVVELDGTHDGDARRALARLDGIREVVVDGASLRARADDGARAVPVVLQALEANGITVSSVTVARPSLDDVYLRTTGRTFTQAEREDDHGREPALAGRA